MKKIYLLLLLSVASIYAQDGTMDNTFHFNGSNGLAIGPLHDYGEICYIQPDGKMIAGGRVKDGSTFGYTKMGFARYDHDGNLDLTFGTNGVALLYPGSQDCFIRQIVNDAAGNLMVLGVYGSRYDVVRISADGIIDNTFGSNGYTVDQSIEMSRILPLNDGKYFLYGTGWVGTSNRAAMIKKYLSNGTVDTSFGTNGMVTLNLGTTKNFSGHLFALPDGKIVAAGYYEYVEDAVTKKMLFLTRFDSATGAIDTTYGTNGFNYSTEMSGFRYATMTDDGTITVLATRTTPTLEANSISTKFDNNGNIIAGETTYFWCSGSALTRQPDGKILYAGWYIVASEANGANCFFTRLNADGTIDGTFGNNGTLKKAFSAGNEDVIAMQIGLDSKIYFVGNKMGADFDFLVGRINSGLVLETETFGNNHNFTIAPNPVESILTINSANQIRESKIYDVQGRLIQSSGSNQTIDVSRLHAGMYILSVVSADNTTMNVKFVKK